MNKTLNSEIDGIFSRWDKSTSPGFALAVVSHGKVVYKRGYGMASLEHGVPISTRSVFDIGSTSKQFVAFCVTILEEKGLLSLSDPVQKYIPEMAGFRWPVTVGHLIHHTSGIRDYLTLMELAGMRFENEYPDKEILGLITKQKALNFKPGEEFLYSNSGYLLLGEIIKRISGKPLREFAERNIFHPLGMRSTHFHDDFKRVVPHKAAGYSLGADGVKVDISIFDVVGDGGVNTTVEDLALWDNNFYKNRLVGGDRVMERMTTPGRFNSGKQQDYARGLFLGEYRGERTVCHGGAWIGYRSEIFRVPERSFSVICLANFSEASPTLICKQVADIYLKKVLSGAPTLTQAGEKKRGGRKFRVSASLAGFYEDRKTGDILEIVVDNGEVVLKENGSDYPLVVAGADWFFIPESSCEVKFRRGKDGTCSGIVKSHPTQKSFHDRIVIRRPSRGSLKSLEGDYYSSELGVVYTIQCGPNGLVLSREWAEKEGLRHVKGLLFKGDYSSFRFVNGRNGSCNGFMLGAGRVQDLFFRRQKRGRN